MNQNKGCTINISTGFLGILTLIFITLKLLGKIDWSWTLVLMPVLAPLYVILALIPLFAFGWIVLKVLEYFARRRRRKRLKNRF